LQLDKKLTLPKGTPIAGAGVNIASANFVVGQTFSGAMMAAGVVLLLVPTWSVFRYKSPF
jgi:hypothetical protein